MSKTTTEDNLDERMSAADDIQTEAGEIGDDVGNAASCETPEDFDANIDAAIEKATNVLADLKAIRS